MMLNGASGATSTCAGALPSGSSQSSNARPGATLPDDGSSSEMQSRASPEPPSASSAAASAKSQRASASFRTETKLSGVTDGASGATATPARNAPRNTAAYLGEAWPQMAIE